MKRALITGATGNVGIEIIKSLRKFDHQLDIVAGVRNPENDGGKLSGYKINFKKFDFTDVKSYAAALDGCNLLFLLRPPQLSEVNTYFKPLINVAKETGVEHIVFVSVQGVENSRFIPHYKIEKLILESNVPYTFLRPAYFMQNFSTTLRTDLVAKKRIFLPAGKARFTLIDVRDIGAVSAKILTHSGEHVNKSYDLTGIEMLTFKKMAEKLSDGLGITIRYQSPNLIHFFLTKRKENLPSTFILVMIMLHYLPRFQKEPPLTNWVEKITGRQPTTFDQFVHDNQALLT